jgi:hypothetical protein
MALITITMTSTSEKIFRRPIGNYLLVIILALSNHLALAQSQEKVYASLILNFTKGIVWPENSQTSAFVVGIYEYPPLAAELKNLSETFRANGKKIVIREVSRMDEIEACNVLFIPAYKAKLLPSILNKFPATPTLIVTNKADAAKLGSGVNFVLVDGKLKYEINCKAIEKRGMKISANVKGLGIVL